MRELDLLARGLLVDLGSASPSSASPRAPLDCSTETPKDDRWDLQAIHGGGAFTLPNNNLVRSSRVPGSAAISMVAFRGSEFECIARRKERGCRASGRALEGLARARYCRVEARADSTGVATREIFELVRAARDASRGYSGNTGVDRFSPAKSAGRPST